MTDSLAGFLLDRYADTQDPADLDRAIIVLLDEVRTVNRWDDLVLCHYRLVLALGMRARRYDALDDFDAAISWAVALLRCLADDTDRDDVSVELLDLHWDRFQAARSDPVQVNRFGTDLAASDLVPPDRPIPGRYLRLLLGVAHLERYDARPDANRTHLDHGIAEVSAILAAVADDGSVSDERLAFAAGLLSMAHRHRFSLDGDPDELDRAVAAAREAVARNDPDEPKPLPLLCLAQALQQRWDTVRDPADLDAAIDASASLRELVDNASIALEHGELLAARADLAGAVDDARAAAEVLTCAATRTDEGPAHFWRRAAAAHRALWTLTQDTAALNLAAAQLDQAFTHDLPPGDDLLSLHIDRLDVERTRYLAGMLPPVTVLEAGHSPYRALVDAAHRAFALNPHAESRPRLAGVLAYAELTVAMHDSGTLDPSVVQRLFQVASTAGDVGPEWETAIEIGLATSEMLAGLTETSSARDAVARITRLSNADLSDTARAGVRDALALAGHVLSTRTGDRHAFDLTMRQLRPAVAKTDPLGMLWFELEALWLSNDRAAMSALLASAQLMLDAVPEASVDIHRVRLVRAFAALVDPSGAAALPLPSLDDMPPGRMGLSYRAAATATAGALVVKGIADGDAALILSAAEYCDELSVTVPESETRLRFGTAGHAGMGYLACAQLGVRTAELAQRAVERYALAFALAVDRHSRTVAMMTSSWAQAIRLTAGPDLRRSRELAVETMRIHAWQVFLQSGTEHALAAARDATEDAVLFAGWCAEDGMADELVGMLDAGRALVLRATSGSHSVPEQLAARGRSDLAAEWRATSGLGRNLSSGQSLPEALHAAASAPTTAADGATEAMVVPDELRLEVLRALGGEREVTGLRPVTVAEIAAALAATDTDALVHLVAGEPGRAVIVSVDSGVTILDLPELSPDGMRGHVRSGGVVRDAHAVDAEPAPNLAELCAWAWKAAMADVLRATVRERPVRLVLLPFGLLGTIPWHAAGDGDHSALDEAVVSYSPSARMFCDGGAWTPGPVRSSLVVGDPRGDLAFAGLEAQAIHHRFYADGTYLGRAGSPADVLDWIGATPVGPSVLHFACHAALDADRPTEAHLVLGDGLRLSAGALLERSRAAALDIEQVFLAACTTGVTGSDHDEVLSLATSFLAAGARTVFGSLWPVPDTETSVLMYMVHRYLRVDGLRPADALRRAQRWMRSPDREVPADLPAALRAQCVPRTVFPTVAWAGFTHYGR